MPVPFAVRTLFVILLLAMGGCTVFLDTDTPSAFRDAEEDVAVPSDTTPTDVDAPDTADTTPDVTDVTDVDAQDTDDTAAVDVPDAEVVGDPGSDVHQPETNGCGGNATLRFNGGPATPGSACGENDEGTLVCASPDLLQCIGASSLNVCGGRGDLGVTLGEPCGRCGDGRWTCDGEGGTQCLGARPANACGGCASLQGRPAAPCSLDQETGRFVCTTPDQLLCLGGNVNACGGSALLTFDGEPALPGDSCETPCGPGLLTCEGESTLACSPDAGTVTPNACGGCQPLRASPTSACGLCADGAWQCDGEDDVRCDGATPPNACGGCGTLDGTPGMTCDDTGTLLCDGDELRCSTAPDAIERNACGGLDELTDEPGTPCGPCENGVIACTGANRTACVGGSARNECGTCDALKGQESDPCGTCGSGALACDEGALICANDAGESARNACGACGELPVTLGDPCGQCLAWTCGSSGGIRCEPTPEAPGCGDLVTCAELACDESGRRCQESDGDEPAQCGGCLDGWTDEDGTCTAATCDDLECAQEARACDDGPPAVCTTCLAGHVDEDETCRPLLACASLDPTCDTLLRTCIEATETDDAVCGNCMEDAIDEDGTCRPRETCEDIGDACDALKRICIDADPERDALCGGCQPGTVDAGESCRTATCDDLDCATLHRTCIEASGDTPASCASCVSGRAVCPESDDGPCDVEIDSDPENCGGCGQTCDLAAGEVCEASECGCPEGTFPVDGACEALAPEPPTVSWLAPPDPSLHDIRPDGFSVSADVTSTGVPPATLLGACVAESPSIPNASSTCVARTGTVETGVFTVEVDNLTEGQMYLVRAFVENTEGRAWTDPIAIRTQTRPRVTLVGAQPDRGRILARLSVEEPGDPVASELGFCVSESFSAIDQGCLAVDALPTSGPQGPFEITGLSDGTDYWLAAFATSGAGTFLTEPTLVTTWALPRAVLDPPEVIGSTALRATVRLEDRGEPADVSRLGFCVGLQAEPRQGQGSVVCRSTTSPVLGVPWSETVGELAPYTAFFLAAFASNEAGTFYGPDAEARTNPSLPNVTTIVDEVTRSGFRISGAMETPLPVPFPTAARAVLDYEGAPEGGRVVDLPTPTSDGPFRTQVTDLPPDTAVVVRVEVFHPAYEWQGSSSSFVRTLGLWVLVSTDGEDTPTCGDTVEATPCATVQHAYHVRAPALERPEVRLLGEHDPTFDLGEEPFELVSGRHLLGGYRIESGALVPSTSRPLLRSDAATALVAADLSEPTRLANLRILTEDQTAAGVSTVGLLVVRSENYLEVESVRITTGRAGPGVSAPPALPGCRGRVGSPGAQGSSSGNAAGGTPVCGVESDTNCRDESVPENCGGRGGLGSSGSGSGNPGWCSSDDGLGATCLTTIAGAGGSSSSCGSGTASAAPAGQQGAPGSAGAPGSPGGALPRLGQDGDGAWQLNARAATDGSPGGTGDAGGGGGGGGGSSQGLFCNNTRRGGGGGSGGTGGAGGAEGSGGFSAGGSIGIVLYDSQVRLYGERLRVTTADGRTGGAGAAGGFGGQGGNGGPGGSRQEDQAGNGGAGGRGGTGGIGGCGGGGGGGSSIAILGLGDASVVADEAPVLSPGLGGPGGDGGCGFNDGDHGISRGLLGVQICSTSAECAYHPGQVQGLEATLLDTGVRLEWEPVPWASGYRILLDDEEIRTVDADVHSFDDDTLEAPGIPAPPARIVLEDAPPEIVAFRWQRSRAPVGGTGYYRVVALSEQGAAPPSAALRVQRRELRPVRYRVYWNESPEDLITEDNRFVRDDPPLGSLNLGTPTATSERDDGVFVSIPEPSTNAPPLVSYRIRSFVVEEEEGEPSQARQFRALIGPISYQWQRAVNSAGTYLTIGEGRTLLDTDVNPGQSRWYRVRVTAPGAPEILISAPVQGTRAP